MPAGLVAAATPAVFDFLGYHFQAGPLVVGIAGVVLARQIITLQARSRPRWGLEIAVMLFCTFVTALLVQDVRSLLYAGVTGIGIGSLGVGVIGIVKSQVGGRFSAALSVLFGLSGAAPVPSLPANRPEPQDDDAAAIDAAMGTLNKQD